MEDPGGWKQWFVGCFVLLSLVVLAGCAERRPPASVADAPERHVGNGMTLLESGDLDDAQAEFDRALGLDAECGPAYVGKGLVFGTKATRSQDAGEKGRLTRQAFDSLRKGKKYAIGDDEKVEGYVAFIRVQTMIRQTGWLADAEENFRYAVAVDRRAPAPYFFMGEAYKEAYRFGDAARMYREVVNLDSDYRTEAGRSQDLMERIQRAAPDTTIGKRIALAETLTRGEAAALFVQELNLDEVCARVDSRNAGPSRTPVAKDLGNYPLRQDVDAVLRFGVRGLELYPDQTFRPGELVTRAAFAVMMADILANAKGDERLVSRFTGVSSAFFDVGNDLSYFGAVMVCTSLGIMNPVNSRGDEFRPMETISGVEALLAVRSLKEYLQTG